MQEHSAYLCLPWIICKCNSTSGPFHNTAINQCVNWCRKLQAGCLRDHVLLVDYVLALQYFRLFRWDDDHHCLLDVHNVKCQQRILNVQLVQDYILELDWVLPRNLFDLAVHLLLTQTNANGLRMT